jgi:hypothetical protein
VPPDTANTWKKTIEAILNPSAEWGRWIYWSILETGERARGPSGRKLHEYSSGAVTQDVERQSPFLIDLQSGNLLKRHGNLLEVLPTYYESQTGFRIA